MYKTTTKFLIVDDFSAMRKILKKILADLGYVNTIDAVNGQVAYDLLLELSKTNSPVELLILDWNMPVMNGFDLLKKCRSEEVFKNLPIMFVTAESEDSQIASALSAGATEYITKPFDAEMVKAKLESCFAKHG